MMESIILLMVGGIQAYIVRKLDRLDARLDRLEVDMAIIIRKTPKRSDDQ